MKYIDRSICFIVSLTKKRMEQKVSVKERILETASRLFYHQGYNSTGINQIIAEAGIAIGSLYKHYQSKSDLLFHYLEQQEIEYFNELDSCLKEEKDPVQKLLKLVDYRIKLQEDSNCSGCHFIKINAEIGREDKRVEQFIATHKKRQKDYINVLIDEISAVKKLSLEKSVLQNIVFLTIEGAVVSATINGNTNELQTLKNTIKQLF